MSDMVNQPRHYQGKRFRAIDITESYGLGSHLTQAFDYIVRHRNKNGRQDVEKALWYLRRILESDKAFETQLAAWGDRTFRIPGEVQGDIVSDFEIGDENLAYAVSEIIASANSPYPKEHILKASNHVAAYLSATSS